MPQSIPNLETTPSTALSLRRTHLCTSLSSAFPRLWSAYHTSCCLTAWTPPPTATAWSFDLPYGGSPWLCSRTTWRSFAVHSQWFDASLWISRVVCTIGFHGLKVCQPAIVGHAWACACCRPSCLSCAAAPPCLGLVCCKTMAAFLRILVTTFYAPWFLPWRSQTICPAAEIWETFRHSLAFAANAQQPPCCKACCPTLCLGTVRWRWRCSPELLDTSSQLRICANRFSFCPLCAFDRRPGSAPQHLWAFCRPLLLGHTTLGCLFDFVLACPTGDISSRPPAATPHSWKGRLPNAWTPWLPERVRHPRCCNTQANKQMFLFSSPGTPAGSRHTAPVTRQTRFSVWKTNNDTEASHHNPACWHSQTTQ